jgi:xanthine dehydrogenase molybdopterin-binding subunit B
LTADGKIKLNHGGSASFDGVYATYIQINGEWVSLETNTHNARAAVRVGRIGLRILAVLAEQKGEK